MATKHPKSEQINQSPLGLRPYAQAKGGYVEKVRRVTDRALEYMAREYKAFMAQSEFKKPYAAPTYDDMEYGTIPAYKYNQPIFNPRVPPIPPIPSELPPPELPFGPGPGPGLTPGPSPQPPGPPTYNTYMCHIFNFLFCPGGPCVPIPMLSFNGSDPITHVGFAIGGGSDSEGHVSGSGGYGAYCPGTGATVVNIMAFTKHGAECSGFGNAKDPDECQDCGAPSIGYTTTQMAINETQQLSVVGGGAGAYTWSVSGGGSITPGGLYTAPSSNANCSNNPTISLLCGGHTMATLNIAVNAAAGNAGYYNICKKNSFSSGACPDGSARLECTASMEKYNYTCSGVVGTDLGSCSGLQVGYDCGPGIKDCADEWPGLCTAAEGDCTSGCPNGCSTGYHDQRTDAQKLAGCCPAAFM